MSELLEVNTPLAVRHLGLCSYADTWALQKELQQSLIRDEIQDTILICEHRPVLTAGTSTKGDSLISSPDTLAQSGIEFFKIERGGDITFHGPGQLVGYPIINLNRKKRDVHWYMRSIEEVVIRTLSRSNIMSTRIAGKTGVWAQDDENTDKNPPRKIASIGVRISRWCTMHGFALNVLDQTRGFSHIHPCGFADIVVTSMEQERIYQRNSRVTPYQVPEVTPLLLSEFASVFGYSILP